MRPLLFSCVVNCWPGSWAPGSTVLIGPGIPAWPVDMRAHPLICPTTFSLESNYLMKLKLLTGSCRKRNCPDISV